MSDAVGQIEIGIPVNGGLYFRTVSEIRRELGLPTVDDLRRQFPRRISAEAVAAFEAEQAAIEAATEAFEAEQAAIEAAAEAFEAEQAAIEAAAEAYELKNKDVGESSGTNVEVENLNPSASTSDPTAQVVGGGANKDLGESSGTILAENPNPAASDLSGTKVEVKESSVRKRPCKDLGEPIESIVDLLNVAATDTASVTEAEVEGGSVRKRPARISPGQV